VAAAYDAGAEIVELDTSRPFTAARARNAGFAALKASSDLPDFVQFVDGDCGLQPDWIAAAIAALNRDPRLGIVTGWRSEINREGSIYNALCDFEWRRPAGEIMTCGGDMMVRSVAFAAVGGFDETVIAAEDDEFCVRIRKADWKIQRLPVEMTIHDAAMARFAQWWSRAVRSGHGFEQVGDMHPEYFTKERRRVWIYGVILPALALIGLLSVGEVFWAVLILYLVSYLRTVIGLHRDGLVLKEAFIHAVFLTLSKFPNFQGILTYKWRQFRGHKMNIIEYK
jgi:GT2 family glycosyltransferase